jgi:hypothetical protein
VIRLGLRLAVSDGREAVIRLVLLVAAVGLGVGLLLAALSGINAVNSQNARYAWLDTAAAHQEPNGRDPLWEMVTADDFDGQTITRVDVAAAGPTSPVPPGIPKLPGPGQYYVSPALASLLSSTPANELAARYPGHQTGLIGDADPGLTLPGPGYINGHREQDQGGLVSCAQPSSKPSTTTTSPHCSTRPSTTSSTYAWASPIPRPAATSRNPLTSTRPWHRNGKRALRRHQLNARAHAPPPAGTGEPNARPPPATPVTATSPLDSRGKTEATLAG